MAEHALAFPSGPRSLRAAELVGDRHSEPPSSRRRLRLRPLSVPPPARAERPTLVPAAPPLVESLDAELVAALRAGQSWAADALFVRVERVIERVLWRVLERRGSDFADLFQETFERLMRSLSEGRFEGSCSLTTWAGSIASHVALDAIRARSKNRRHVPVEELEHSDGVDSSRRLEARAEVQQLLDVLGAMRPERARAVFLFDVLGHSLPEVAELTHVSVAAAQSRLVRGRRELLERFGQAAEPAQAAE